MRYSRRTKNLDVIFCVVSLHIFTRPMRHVNNRIISTSVIRTLCYSCLCLNIKTYKSSRSCDVIYICNIDAWRVQDLSSLLRTNHPIESSSPFMWDLLRMYEVLDLVTLLFSTAARLRRFQPQPWVKGMNDLEKETMAIIESAGWSDHQWWEYAGTYPSYAWSNPAYSQSDTGMSVTTHKVSITLLRWRPVPRFDYGVSMRTLENSSCLCGSSGIDELCWSTRLPDSMDKRKHGPLTPTEYGVVLRTLAAYQSFFMLSPSNRTLIITTPYYGVLS